MPVDRTIPINCPQCQRVVRRHVRGLCADCLREEHERLAILRSHLRKHPDQPVAQVSEETQIPPDRILRWLREGRIETARSSTWLTCERCRSRIVAGRLCAVCGRETARLIAVAAKESRRPVATPKPPEERRRRRQTAETGERFDLR